MTPCASPPPIHGGKYNKQCKGTGLTSCKGLHFVISYRHTTRQCHSNAASVFQYAIQLHYSWFTWKICCHKNTRHWKDVIIKAELIKSTKLLSYIIFICDIMLKGQLITGPTNLVKLRDNLKTDGLNTSCFKEVTWSIVKKNGIVILDIFKGCLTLEVISMISTIWSCGHTWRDDFITAHLQINSSHRISSHRASLSSYC
jgi:hypothetical protein